MQTQPCLRRSKRSHAKRTSRSTIAPRWRSLATARAVSYTHLDVYKRQVRESVLKELLEQYSGEELKEAIRDNADRLVPCLLYTS